MEVDIMIPQEIFIKKIYLTRLLQKREALLEKLRMKNTQENNAALNKADEEITLFAENLIQDIVQITQPYYLFGCSTPPEMISLEKYGKSLKIYNPQKYTLTANGTFETKRDPAALEELQSDLSKYDVSLKIHNPQKYLTANDTFEAKHAQEDLDPLEKLQQAFKLESNVFVSATSFVEKFDQTNDASLLKANENNENSTPKATQYPCLTQVKFVGPKQTKELSVINRQEKTPLQPIKLKSMRG
ncbi:MAG: hypothetical protein WC748_06210 [Legionellales bacterium]|jgi:hypothetical protein